MTRALLMPVLLVAALLCVYVAIDPFGTPARETVPWPALADFYANDFTAAGFRATCDLTAAPECRVEWKSPSNANGEVIDVYHWGDQQRRRNEILVGFHEAARKQVSSSEALRLTAILDGFLQSGLRRRADRAMRRAEEGNAWSFRVPPFELSGKRVEKRREYRDVIGLDPNDSVILTGLPTRPSFRADVYAQGWRGEGTAVRITQPGKPPVVRLLRSTSTAGCGAIAPTSPQAAAPCRAVNVVPCLTGNECAASILEVHALSDQLVLVRAGENGKARLVSRHGEPARLGDLFASVPAADAAEPYVIESLDPKIPDFRVELLHGGATPISRQRMVNGRWERWYAPESQPWLENVVDDWQRIATAGQAPIDQSKRVTMSLDVSLQRDLEARLGEWMSANAEKLVLQHLEQRHYGDNSRRELNVSREGITRHRRAVPRAGITVLDARSGNVLAIASYPPATALITRNGQPDFAPGWRERLAGPNAPSWAVRDILEILQDRLHDDVNANFVTHPIGSTFKPILLSLTMDGNDSISQLFDLMVTGHGEAVGAMGVPACATCADPRVQAVAGLPLGPWGAEDGVGGHGNDAWIDRSEFLVSSCNKYAITLGVLSLLDWNPDARRTGEPCCWNAARDSFGFSHWQDVGGDTAPPAIQFTIAQQLPPITRNLTMQPDGSIVTNADFPSAPIFQRLSAKYGVGSREDANSYDPMPWHRCMASTPANPNDPFPVGSIERTELRLTPHVIGPAFTNLFTGAGHNWWSNVKLAEAYARLAMNQRIEASFCGSGTPAKLFEATARHEEMLQILSRQRGASWVKIPNIEAWVQAQPERITLSKTGTTLRAEGYESTGVFAIYIGRGEAFAGEPLRPTRAGDGIVVVAHVDDIGESTVVTGLVDFVFPALRTRLE
jgi:hypothetical protein